MKKSTKTIRKGAVGAGLGAVAGSPFGPAGMAAGAALGSKIGGKKKETASAPAPAPVQNSRKKRVVSKQPSDPPHGPTTPIMRPGGIDNMEKSGKPVQKILPALAAGAIGGKLLGLSDDKPLQKILPALAAGAIGGKLLGLSKKNNVPVQKIIGGLISSLGQAAGGAVGSLGLSKKDETPVQKIVGELVSNIGQTAGKLTSDIMSQDDDEIEKHRGKSFHSHKKNPFRRSSR